MHNTGQQDHREMKKPDMITEHVCDTGNWIQNLSLQVLHWTEMKQALYLHGHCLTCYSHAH